MRAVYDTASNTGHDRSCPWPEASIVSHQAVTPLTTLTYTLPYTWSHTWRDAPALVVKAPTADPISTAVTIHKVVEKSGSEPATLEDHRQGTLSDEILSFTDQEPSLWRQPATGRPFEHRPIS